ncbi:hypothetical protein LTR62_007481 [Meristemomyces frigidus]|uniref:Uncharacterized protein n=1 Tax=Meristemomyces frigidus TaxID=1508187 RepID=A0AAN7TBU8_9PEZI|nr:hypothetical protein LTR62_007481 [Meristemomyces frigidus]
MPFVPPSWTLPLPEVPDSISVETFMWDEKYGRQSLSSSENPFTDGLAGRTYTPVQVKERVDHLARALCKQFGWRPDQGSEYDKIIGIFSLNTIDYVPLTWAIHRLGGIASCASAAYNADELTYQMKDSGAKVLFTCAALLATTLTAAKKLGIPKEKVFILPMAPVMQQGLDISAHKTLEDFVTEGAKLEPMQSTDKSWSKGEGARRTAYLCYSSGTSGLPKGVMISHRNVIANTLQIATQETPNRNERMKSLNLKSYTEIALGLLPMSHIYGLVVGSHAGAFRGDGVIVLPRYDFKLLLKTIQDYKINMLYLVPPMIIHLTKSKEIVKQFDLSSVIACFTGAAPLGKETADDLLKIFPDWAVRQGYGLTETSTVVCSTVPNDIWFGSSGSLIPGTKVRLVTVEGNEITGYDQPGELWVASPSVVLGYLHNDKATKETFIDEKDGLRYMRTGDEALIAKSPNGHEHIFITDRIKELIKVKGNQVAPAELEAHLLTHPAVNDCVVIGVPSDREGEVPKAFVVKAPGSIEESDALLKRQIAKHVEDHKTDYKRLRGGIEFIDEVPKSASGKILRRLIRDQEREKMRKQGAKFTPPSIPPLVVDVEVLPELLEPLPVLLDWRGTRAESVLLPTGAAIAMEANTAAMIKDVERAVALNEGLGANDE